MAKSKYFPDLTNGESFADVEQIETAFSLVEKDMENAGEKADQTFSSTSKNAQSGVAIAKELEKYQKTLPFDTKPKKGSTNPVTSDGVNTAINNLGVATAGELARYVLKETGKSLSTNDYTDAEKQKNADNADKLENLGFQRVYETGAKTIYRYDDGVYAFSGVFKANESVDVPTVYAFENLMIVNSFTDGTTKYVLLFQSTIGIISYFTITNDSCSEETYNLGNFIKKTDYASADKAGIVQIDIKRGIGIVPTDHKLYVNTLITTDIKDRTDTIGVLTMGLLNHAVKAALTDDKRITDMTEPEKINARGVIGAESKPYIMYHANPGGVSLHDREDHRISSNVTPIMLVVPSSIGADYECCFSFQSGETATTLTYPGDTIKFVGVDCDESGDFIPTTNRNYEVVIKNLATDGATPVLVARVGVY